MMRLALLGHPVAGSLSPLMHNAALAAAGIPGRYEAIDLPPEALGPFLAGAGGRDYAGFNLTAPHKTAGLAFCRRLSREARLAGAVNTIAPGFSGHNTDTLALRELMAGWATGPGPFRALILGHGGAARAAAVAAAEAGAVEVILAGRDVTRARRVAGDLAQALASDEDPVARTGPHREPDPPTESGPRASISAVSLEEVLGVRRPPDPENLPEIVVQATSAPDGVLPPRLGWRPDCLAIELNYRPPRTSFLAGATALGARCVNGLEVLLRQGEIAFTLLCGQAAPRGVMRRALEEEVARRAQATHGR